MEEYRGRIQQQPETDPAKIIVNRKEQISLIIENRGIRGSSKMLGRLLILLPTSPFIKLKTALLGEKTPAKLYTSKSRLNYEQQRKSGKISYLRAMKISTHMDLKRYNSSLKNIFKSYAAHQAIDAAAEHARDCSQDPNLVEIPYQHPRGLFGKKNRGN